MIPSISALVVEQFVDQALIVDATLASMMPSPDDPTTARVYESMIPQSTNQTPQLYPAIIYDWVASSPDTMAEGGYRVMQTIDYQFRVIGRGTSRAALAPIYQRMDSLIANSAARVSGGQIIQCVRQNELLIPIAVADGIPYTGIGGRYRFVINAYSVGGGGPWIGPGYPTASIVPWVDNFVASANQSVFPLSYQALNNTPSVVFVNGVPQVYGTDFTTSTAGSVTVITFTSGLPAATTVQLSYFYPVLG